MEIRTLKQLQTLNLKDWNLRLQANKARDGRVPKTKHKSNIICTFDIETTSVFVIDNIGYSYSQAEEIRKKEKLPYDKFYPKFSRSSVCYLWKFAIEVGKTKTKAEPIIITGRTLEEFKELLLYLARFDVSLDIWVHNLSFEFEFLRNILRFDDVLMINEHKIINATTHLKGRGKTEYEDFTDFWDYNGVFKFRCSYMLSNLSLEKLSVVYNLPVEKLSGTLDYALPRHSKTKLTDEEQLYGDNDVLVLYEYIKLEREEYKTLSLIPNTSTGKVRSLIRKKFNEKDSKTKTLPYRLHSEKVARVTPDLLQYEDMVRAYAGGYVHANALNAGKIHKNVKSLDIKSAYPSVMVFEKFPWKYKFTEDSKITIDEILENTEEMAYLITISLKDLQSLSSNVYISRSKCRNIKGAIYDNGRVLHAEYLEITLTEQDLIIIDKNYGYSEIEIIFCESAQKSYLPVEIVECINDLFGEKERVGKLLESDDKYQAEYAKIKSYINSIYGMIVTNYIKDGVSFDSEKQEVSTLELDQQGVEDGLGTLKENLICMLPFAVGIWVTAYIRKLLWHLINYVDRDIVYCDTDSIKILNSEKYKDLIENFNEYQAESLEIVREERGLKLENMNGVGTLNVDSNSKKGKVKSDVYSEFCTLGAKKYCYRDLNGLHLTVSGLPKKSVIALKDDIKNFNPTFTFDVDVANKNQLTYHGYSKFTLIDEMGIPELVETNFGVNIRPVEFSLSITDEYENYMQALDKIEKGESAEDFIRRCSANTMRNSVYLTLL